MEWDAVRREEARNVVAAGMRCKWSGEALRVAAVSECLRAASHLSSAPEGGRGPWEPAVSVKLTAMVRRRLAPLWPDLSGDREKAGPGVMKILDSLAKLGDMVRLDGGRWLPAPPHGIALDGGAAVLLGGGPREALLPAASASARVAGRVRLVDRATCAGWMDFWEPEEWIGAPSEGAEAWSEAFLTRIRGSLADAPHDMGEAFAYNPREWVPLSEMSASETGLRLCKTYETGAAGRMSSYFVGEFARGRLRRLYGVPADQARRLRFWLDARAGRPVRVIAALSPNGLVHLKLMRRLPEREGRVLLLGWQMPAPEGEQPGIAHHLFAAETLPVVKMAFEGLGIVFEERSGAQGGKA